MLDEGLITREEYEEQKEALLLELLLKRRGAGEGRFSRYSGVLRDYNSSLENHAGTAVVKISVYTC